MEPNDTQDEVTTRKAKPESYLVVGNWKRPDDNISVVAAEVFVPTTKQPSERITELGKAQVWVKKNFAETGGKFAFVRRIVGVQTVGVKTSVTSEFSA